MKLYKILYVNKRGLKMKYIENIPGLVICYYYFTFKNEDKIKVCIEGVYRDFKIYTSKKGYYINYKGKRYYNKSTLIRNYN